MVFLRILKNKTISDLITGSMSKEACERRLSALDFMRTEIMDSVEVSILN